MADVQFDLSGNAGGLLKDLADVRANLQQATSDAAATKKAIDEAFRQGAASVQSYQKELNESLKEQSKQREIIDALTKKLKQLEEAKRTAFDNTATAKLNAELEKTKKLVFTIEELNAKILARKSFILTETDITKIAKYNAEIEVLQKEMTRLSNVGKTGFDEAGNKIKVMGTEAETAAKKTNLLSKGFGFVKQAAYLIPGLGIAGVFNIIGEAVVALVKDLLKGSNAFDEVIERTRLLSEGFDSNNFKDAVKSVNELRINIDLAKKGVLDKEKVLHQYNETLGKTTGEVNNLDDAESALVKNGEAYIKMQLYKAAANLALDESAKSLVKAEQERLKQAKEFQSIGTNASVFSAGQSSAPGYVPGVDPLAAAAARQAAAKKAQDKIVKDNEDAANKQLDIAKKFQADAAKIAKDFSFDFFGGKQDEKTKAAREKSIQDLKDYGDKIIALEKQIADARIRAMQEGRAKDIALEQAAYDDLIKQAVQNVHKYEQEVSKTQSASNKTAENKQKEIEQLRELIKLENQKIESDTAAHAGRLLAIDLKYYQDAQESFKKAEKSITDVLASDQGREEDRIKSKYEALTKVANDAIKKLQENIKDGVGNPETNSLQIAVLDGQQIKLEKDLQTELEAIRLKYHLKTLNESEQLAKAQIEIITDTGLTEQQLEKTKEREKLRIVIEYGKKKLAALEASGDAENALQILQLKKTIQDAQKELDENKAKTKSLAEYLFGKGKDAGLYNSEAEFNDIKAGFNSLVSSITEIWTAGIDQRINAQQRLLDELSKQMDEQAKVVDREKDLMEQGYANNFAIENKKLEDLKRRNQQEKDELKKQQEERAKAAQAMAIIQGTVTAIQLAATAAGYFANSTQYGPIAGPILALAAIATMFATFATAKQKGKEVSQYRKGGDFDLTDSHTRHEDGGIDLIDKRTGQPIANAEGGEYGYIFRDGAHAKKFKPILDQINTGRLSPYILPGIRFDEERLATVAKAAETQITVINQNDRIDGLKATMQEVADNTKKLTESDRTLVEYHDGYRIEKKGLNIRKVISRS